MQIRIIVSKCHPSDTFEKLVKENKINWTNDPLPKDAWIPESFLSDLKYQLGDIAIMWKGTTGYILKILDDELIGYLDVYGNETFLWCNHDHSEGIHPDVALAHNLGRLPTKVIIDDKRGSIIEVDGVRIIDKRTGKDREKLANKEIRRGQ